MAELEESGNAAALAASERKVLGSRDAWRFVYPLKVKVLDFDPSQHCVHVEMTNEGRLQGTDWLIDPDALTR